MTYEEYIMRVVQAASDHPHWRWGQAAFNELVECRPALAEFVRGSGLDPFYLTDAMDQRMFDFLRWVREQWATN